MYTHKLTPDHHFIADGAEDPIQKTKLTPGDSIVVCAHCRSPFLISSWKLVNSKDRLLHGGIDNTLQYINNGPTSGNLRLGRTKSSSPPVQPPPSRELHRPSTQRVEQERSKVGSWLIAVLVLIVIGVLWFQYKKNEQPVSKPKSSPIPQVQFGEKPKIERKLKAQNSVPIPQDTVVPSMLQAENSGQDTTLENVEKIEFKIYSDPDGAQVYFDEKLVGITPVTLKALPGKYRLRIVKDGYRPQGTTIRISPTSKTEFFNTLSEEK